MTYTIYVQGSFEKLRKDCKLVPDPDGPIEILKMFWKAHESDPLVKSAGMVPVLLVYADMMTVENGRASEIAKKIYDEHLS